MKVIEISKEIGDIERESMFYNILGIKCYVLY